MVAACLKIEDFQISQSPLVRLTLISLGRNKYHLIWSCHLILLDGWSIPLIFGEALSFYEGLRGNKRKDLPLPVSPAGYLQWLKHQDESRARAYWQRALQGLSRPTPLGDDRASIGLAELEAQYHEEVLLFSEADTDKVKVFAAGNQLTPNSLVQGAWALHLASLQPVSREGDLPLSYSQQRMWLLEQISSGSAAFNLPLGMKLRGRLNVNTLEQTFGEVTRRHEVLRTSFPARDGQPVQVIAPPAAFSLPLVDLINLEQQESEAELQRIAREDAARVHSI